MGRLIDADILIAELKESALHHCNNPREDSLLQRDRVIVRAQPTVEAIPKAVIKKFLEEGTKNISENVLAIVREDYIHKSEYEQRLKADLEAILVELQVEIHELENPYPHEKDNLLPLASHNAFYEAKSEIEDLVEEKIDALKGGREANERH